MKRGIFRIIAGIIMISLQLLAMMALTSAGVDYTSSDVLYNIGFYGIGVTGVILLIFGIKAYKKGLRSQLVLHTKSRKIHTVIKWIMFVITTLVCVDYSVAFIQNFDNFNIYTLLIAFATLAFAVYLLFYIYKKPSCLPSTCLIFMGVAYLYGILSNMTYYLIYASEYDFWTMMLIFRIVPQLIAGILYIILATKLYKEKFSVNAVKVIGWVTFVLEFSNVIIYPILISFEYGFVFYLFDISNLLYALFVLGLLLYISAFKINTFKQRKVYGANDMVRFCRKCGNTLLENASFCNKCGTEVIEEVGGQENEM